MLFIVDWYCCNVGSFHMTQAVDPSTPKVQSEPLRSFLLLEDSVLFLQAAIAMGAEDLHVLAAEYVTNGLLFEAAKAKFASANLAGGEYTSIIALMKEAHLLLEQGELLSTREAQQLGEFQAAYFTQLIYPCHRLRITRALPVGVNICGRKRRSKKRNGED